MCWDPNFEPGPRLLRLAYRLMQEGNRGEALSAAIGAQQLLPNRLEPYTVLSAVYDKIPGLEEWQIKAADAGLSTPPSIGDDPQEDLMRADLHYNKALALNRLYRWQEALEVTNLSHRLNQSNPWTMGLAAQLLDELGQTELAIKFNRGAVALIEAPDNPYAKQEPARKFRRETYLALAICYLNAGDLPKYFEYFEKRLELGGTERIENRLYQAGELWRPRQAIRSHAVLILEQGIGDQIQFARLAKTFREEYSYITELIVHCHPAVKSVMSRMPWFDGAISTWEGFEEEATFISSFDLIRWNFERGESEPFGAWTGPYIKANRTADIPREAARDGTQKSVIGFCWQGSKSHVYDWARSFPLETFLAWAEPRKDRCTFVSLQHGEDAKLPDWIIDGDRGPFDELAEVVNACDVIVGPDTAPLHLAGAMGKPVVMLHTFNQEWRWKRPERFYAKTFRHLRQSVPGNWKEVLSRLGPELDNILSAVEQAELQTAMAR